jgi:hypothetical protein
MASACLFRASFFPFAFSLRLDRPMEVFSNQRTEGKRNPPGGDCQIGKSVGQEVPD